MIRTILIYSALTLVIIGSIATGVYVYKKNTAQNKNFDTTISAFNEKVQAQAQVSANRLKEMQDTALAQADLNSFMVDQHLPITQAFHDADILFNNTGSDHAIFKISTVSSKIISDIESLRNKLYELLQQWQTVNAKNIDSGTPDITLINETNREIVALQEYISKLQSIVNSLNSESGLTQQQIDSYQSTVDTTKQAVDDVAGRLNDAETLAGVIITNGQAQVTAVTPADIQDQKNIVDRILQDAAPTPPETGSDGSSDVLVLPDTGMEGDSVQSDVYQASPPDPSGKPRLIEGANTY